MPPLPGAGRPRAWWRAPASASALAFHLSRAAAAHAGPLLVVARDNHAAHQLEADLHTLLGEAARAEGALPVLPFPDWETLPYDRFSPHPDIVSQRIRALQRLPTLARGIVVVPVATLMQRLPPPRHLVGGSFDLATGQRLDLDAEKRRLEAAGYRNVPQVLDPGDFAVRGGLLDVYPMGSELPLRIELLDQEIDSIRAFDPESQRSLERLESVRMLPGRELPMDEVAVGRALARLRERFDIDIRRSALFQDLKAGAAPASSTTCRCSWSAGSTTPPRCSTTSARRRFRSWAKARWRRPTRSGRRPANATSSAATTSSIRCCRRPRSGCRRTPCANG
jgi:transcription-repair coupling factor (superfamily II helicase)